MPGDGDFAVFVEAERGPEWRGFFRELETAKETAQELADREKFEAFVFSFKDASEIARRFPQRKPRAPEAA